jgi:hypothetical protein
MIHKISLEVSKLKRYFHRDTALIVGGLGLIIVVAASLNLILVSHNGRPPIYDYATYLSESVKAFDAIRSGSFPHLLSAIANPYRPPLVQLSALPFYMVFGTEYRSALLANLLYLIILIICTYKLTKTVSRSTGAALAASGIICFIPGVICFDRVFGLDFPSMALVSAGLYFTIANKDYNSLSRSVVLGVVLGLGMLTKWSYFFFVAPLVVAELIRYRQSINLKNLLISMGIAAIVALPWYWYAIGHGLIQSLIHFGWGAGAKAYAASGNLFDLTSLLYYPRNLVTHIIGPLFSIGLLFILCLSAIKLIKRPEPGQDHHDRNLALSLVASVLVPLIVFILLEDKSVRFILPAVPCLLVLLVWAGSKIRLRGVKVGVYLLAGLVVIGSTLSLIGALQPSLGARLGIYERWATSDTFVDYNDYAPPRNDDWKVEAIIRTIANENPKANVGILSNHWVFNQDTLYYYAIRMGYYDLTLRDFRNAQVFTPYDNLSTYQIVLVKTKNIGSDWDTVYASARLKELMNPGDPFYSEHEMIQSYDLPDGSQLRVFLRTNR